MIKELDCVVVTASIPSERLEAGDVGTVVHIYKNGVAYEVEFPNLSESLMPVVTLEAHQVRLAKRSELARAKELSAH